MKINEEQQQQQNEQKPPEVLSSKYHGWEFLIILWLLMIICDLCK